MEGSVFGHLWHDYCFFPFEYYSSMRAHVDRIFGNRGGFEDKEIGVIRSTLKWRARPGFPSDESREESAGGVLSERVKVTAEKVA